MCDIKARLAKYREDIQFTTQLGAHQLNFNTTWGLFSPREIDEGTRLLIPYLDLQPQNSCLDLGCGYGPIGLYMAKEVTQGKVILADKDFVAIEYTQKNIDHNRLKNCAALLSNGFNHIPMDETFDVIVSNIPAKVGKELLTLWLYDAKNRLTSNGKLYIVTINGLRQFMKRNLMDVFDNYKKLKQGAHYTIATAEKPDIKR